MNEKIAKSLLIAEENKIFDLNAEDCQKLYSEFDKIKYPYDEEIPGIWQLSNITFSEKNFYDDAPEIFKIHEFNYQYVNNYPKNWIALGNLIIDLLGFDLLNINLKNLITTLHYNITSDGVYEKQTNNKLKLKKLNFNIVSFEEPFNPFNFSIDSDDNDFERIIKLLDDYGVYKWYDKDYAENIIESDDFNDFKGNSWFIELIFENGRVLNLRGDNAYPDAYRDSLACRSPCNLSWARLQDDLPADSRRGRGPFLSGSAHRRFSSDNAAGSLRSGPAVPHPRHGSSRGLPAHDEMVPHRWKGKSPSRCAGLPADGPTAKWSR